MDNVIDKLLLEWSWRCEKGYPDINNKKDLKILEEIFDISLTEVKGFNMLSPAAQGVATSVVNVLGLTTQDIRQDTRNRFIVVAPKGQKRTDLIAVLEKFENDKTNTNKLGIVRNYNVPKSSIGGFVHTETGVEMIFKDSVTQSLGAAGKENEAFFTSTLNSLLNEEPKTIILQSNKTSVTIDGAVWVEDISRPDDKSKKADVLIHTLGKLVPISIKEDGDFRWGSVMELFKDLLETFVYKGSKECIENLRLVQDVNRPALLLMQNLQGRQYGAVYIKNYQPLTNNLQKLLFGTDNAIVTQRSFTDSDFSTVGNTITVDCTNLYTDLTQIPAEKLPIIRLERNARHATNIDNPTRRGIQLRIVPEYLLTKGQNAYNLVLDWQNDVIGPKCP